MSFVNVGRWLGGAACRIPRDGVSDKVQGHVLEEGVETYVRDARQIDQVPLEQIDVHRVYRQRICVFRVESDMLGPLTLQRGWASFSFHGSVLPEPRWRAGATRVHTPVGCQGYFTHLAVLVRVHGHAHGRRSATRGSYTQAVDGCVEWENEVAIRMPIPQSYVCIRDSVFDLQKAMMSIRHRTPMQ